MTKMRIALLLTQDLSSPSGIGRYYPISRELVELGHEVNLLVLHADYDNCRERQLNLDGVYVNYIGQMHVKKVGNVKKYFKPLSLIWLSIVAIFRTLSNVIKIHPDIVYVGKPHPMNGIPGAIYSVFNKRTVLIVDCDDHETSSNYFAHRWQKTTVSFFEKWVIRRAQYLSTNTISTRNRIVQLGQPEEVVFYLPNGTDPRRFSEPKNSHLKKLTEEVNPSLVPIVSYIGSVDFRSHPVLLLVDAFTIVHKTHPKAKLMIVGAGKDMENLQKQIEARGLQDCVIITGRIPGDSVHYYYLLSTLTVDPVYDNDASRGRCPLKMLEAWITGTPFVSGDVGDRKLLSGNPEAAVLCEPGNAESLAGAIIRVLDDVLLRQKLIETGKQRAQEFDWAKMVKGLEKFFLAAIADKSN